MRTLFFLFVLTAFAKAGPAQDINRDVSNIISSWTKQDITPRPYQIKDECATCHPLLNSADPLLPVKITLSNGYIITITFNDATPGSCLRDGPDCLPAYGCTTLGDMYISTPISIKVEGVLVLPPGRQISLDLPPILNCGSNHVINIYNSSGTVLLASVTYSCTNCL